MVALADTTENLLVLQLSLHRLVLLIHIMGDLSSRREFELNVVAHVGGCWIWTRLVSFLLSKLWPFLFDIHRREWYELVE